MALTDVILLVITVLLIALFLFVGDKLVGSKNVKLTSSYYLRALITAIVIILLIIGVSAVIGAVNVLGIGNIIPILAFVVSCYAIKMLLMSSTSYERSVWVGIITWILIYIVDYIFGLFGLDLIQYI